MRVWLSNVTSIQSMHTMNLVNKTGSLFKPTMTETIQILYTTQEESQWSKDSDKEETSCSKSNSYWISSCLSGQHSTSQHSCLPSWFQQQDTTTQQHGTDTILQCLYKNNDQYKNLMNIPLEIGFSIHFS